MAPKPPKGSRDKESKQIAEELVGLLKDQLDLEEDIFTGTPINFLLTTVFCDSLISLNFFR